MHRPSDRMAGASTATVHDAGARLISSWKRPVLFVWSREDPVFALEHAHRYAQALRSDGGCVDGDRSRRGCKADLLVEAPGAVRLVARGSGVCARARPSLCTGPPIGWRVRRRRPFTTRVQG